MCSYFFSKRVQYCQYSLTLRRFDINKLFSSMSINELFDRTNLHTHLKGQQMAFTHSHVMPLGSSVFKLEKLTT